MESFKNMSCADFVSLTGSEAAAPGGGSVSAVAAAFGTALAGMVAALSCGERKHSLPAAEQQRILEETKYLQKRFLELADEDAENFLSLLQAYKLKNGSPSEKERRQAAVQRGLKKAVLAPAETLRLSRRALRIQAELCEKGVFQAVSDVGCGAVLLKAAMQSAFLNVKINLRLIKDEAFVAELRREMLSELEEGLGTADRIYAEVSEKLEA